MLEFLRLPPLLPDGLQRGLLCTPKIVCIDPAVCVSTTNLAGIRTVRRGDNHQADHKNLLGLCASNRGNSVCEEAHKRGEMVPN